MLKFSALIGFQLLEQHVSTPKKQSQTDDASQFKMYNEIVLRHLIRETRLFDKLLSWSNFQRGVLNLSRVKILSKQPRAIDFYILYTPIYVLLLFFGKRFLTQVWYHLSFYFKNVFTFKIPKLKC